MSSNPKIIKELATFSGPCVIERNSFTVVVDDYNANLFEPCDCCAVNSLEFGLVWVEKSCPTTRSVTFALLNSDSDAESFCKRAIKGNEKNILYQAEICIPFRRNEEGVCK